MARNKKGYFADFPQIEYQGKIARNLMARPKIKEHLLNNPNAFYDFIIKEDLRADQIAGMYYNDPHMAWLVFLANGITDPYYEWPMNQNQFNDFLISKYGTVAAAQAKILHYKHNTKGTIITKETKDLAATFQTSYSASNYTAVYAYDYEDELNEAKRNIKLIDAGLANKAKELLRDIMIG